MDALVSVTQYQPTPPKTSEKMIDREREKEDDHQYKCRGCSTTIKILGYVGDYD